MALYSTSSVGLFCFILFQFFFFLLHCSAVAARVVNGSFFGRRRFCGKGLAWTTGGEGLKWVYFGWKDLQGGVQFDSSSDLFCLCLVCLLFACFVENASVFACC